MRNKLNQSALFLVFIVFILTGSTGFFYIWLIKDLPGVENISTNLQTPSLQITDRFGRLLYEVLPDQGGRHVAVNLLKIPRELQLATIATEDHTFYTNPGVDPAGIARALWLNLHSGEVISGGSTLTQQVARNLLLEPEERRERSLRRKLREALLAWQLTRRLTKDQILELYLNQTYYGGMAFGVEAAAQTFFGKPVEQLDLAESALLAGLPQAPSLYNPFSDLEAARERQRSVLGLMENAGYIDADQRAAAEREPLILEATPYPINAPHFVTMVRNEIESLFSPEELVQNGGLVVRTSLDLDWQRHAEKAIERQLQELASDQDGLGHNVNNAALAAIDPHNGDILAMVGSPDFFDSVHNGFINMALAPRQPGSALKPLLYAAAMDPQQDRPWTAATALLDVRTTFLTHEGLTYTPANYDLKEHGPVSVRQALGSSLNIPAVITLDNIGLQGLFDLTQRMGITTLKDPYRYDLSLALGGGEVRLLELTAAYGAFASGGMRVTPRAILEITSSTGEVLHEAPPPGEERILDERLAWLISDILSDDQARTLGFSSNSILQIGRPAAVKTGTTSNFHDNWTVGYTPDLVVGVWTGNAGYEPMRGVDGLTGAAPIWHEFMRTVLGGKPPRGFSRPDGLKRLEVCALSGLLPTSNCPYNRREWFIEGTEPTTYDALYRQVQVDRNSGDIAGENTPPQDLRTLTVLDLPPRAANWARSQGITLLSNLSSGNQSSQLVQGQTTGLQLNSTAPAALELISPGQGSVYQIDRNYVAGAQRLQLTAGVSGDFAEISFWVDGNLISRLSAPPYRAWWQIEPGLHTAWVEGVRPDEEVLFSEKVTFEVK